MKYRLQIKLWLNNIKVKRMVPIKLLNLSTYEGIKCSVSKRIKQPRENQIRTVIRKIKIPFKERRYHQAFLFLGLIKTSINHNSTHKANSLIWDKKVLITRIKTRARLYLTKKKLTSEWSHKVTTPPELQTKHWVLEFRNQR